MLYYYANPVTGEVESHALSDATWAEVKRGHPVGGARVMNGEEDLWTEEPAAAQPTEPPAVVDAPYCSGSGVIGEPLTVTMGNWQNEPTEYAYLWKKMQEGNPVALPGATEPIYAPTNQDANQDVFCTVMATNSAGSAAADSNMVTVKPPTGSRR
jgi:hypothetical protein